MGMGKSAFVMVLYKGLPWTVSPSLSTTTLCRLVEHLQIPQLVGVLPPEVAT